MNRNIAFAAVAAVAAFAAGCASRLTVGLEVAMEEGGATCSVLVDDVRFGLYAEVESASARRLETGFLAGEVRVRNRSEGDFPLQYRFSWFDAAGMEVQPGGRPWEQTVMHGGEAVSLPAVAPDRRAVRFVARLRRLW